MLTVALVNEAIERRSRQRWSVLAQYVMLQLVRDARMVWTGIAKMAGLMPPDPDPTKRGVLTATMSIDAGSGAVRDTDRLTAALQELLADSDRRKQLHDTVTIILEHNDAVLGRWAAVMLNADVYAELIDRHVELAGDMAWIEQSCSVRVRRPRRAKAGNGPTSRQGSSRAEVDDALPGTTSWRQSTQLAEQLDRGTLELAPWIVPIEWWREQLTASPPSPSAPTPGHRRV